ncbi:mutator protein MutT [Bacillus tianshenii]|uniref:Mutator protein MutT n=1 Tax=Sutcliffiella tianshenii TaxID=1463404 RepID=A0ABS2P2B5_9BACI|nr:NUDIX hydrolase [Bacillus tianshenii]MBM7621101.1 mutator protein MutT [Bacillus tianshenii]
MLDYIMKVREKVGTMPLVVSVAGCLILDEQNRVLLQHRTDNHNWSHPGGAVEVGESVEDAVKREVFEETGLRLQNLEFFNIYSGESQHYIYPNGDEVYFVNIIYICKKFEGTPIADQKETKSLQFFELNSLPNMTPNNQTIIDDLKKTISQSISLN